MARRRTLGKGAAGRGPIWCCPDILAHAPSPSMSEGGCMPPSPGDAPLLVREVPGHPAPCSQSMQGPWPLAASSELWGAVVKEKSWGSATGEDLHEQ